MVILGIVFIYLKKKIMDLDIELGHLTNADGSARFSLSKLLNSLSEIYLSLSIVLAFNI